MFANPEPLLPTDRQLGTLKDLAFAADPVMRALARIELTRLGRDDVFDPDWYATKPAGQPPRGLPAGPR